MRRLEFTVLGVPAPKGSSRAIMRAGNAVNVPSGSDVNKAALQSWDVCVRSAAINAIHRAAVSSYCDSHGAGGIDVVPGVFFGEVPLRLEIEFRMRRRKGDFKKDGSLKPSHTIPKFHIVKPDLSKLVRATEDSMIGTVFLDDASIAELFVRKVYAVPGQEGARIRITEITR